MNYLYHAESDSVLKVKSKRELRKIFNTPDGALCNLITRREYYAHVRKEREYKRCLNQ